MSKNYNTRTASLKATIADIRNLDAKKIDAENINLKNKNILEYIEESVPTITHSQDTRETVYAKDLWGQWIETKDDGTIIVHDDYLSNPNSSFNSRWLENVRAIRDNKAYSGITTDAEGNFTGVSESSVIANIQTEMIKDGSYMFGGSSFSPFPFVSFSGDLSSLVDGNNMFYYASLESFSGDLSNLINGFGMFGNTALTSFSEDLSSLVYGTGMFHSTPLTSFSGDLSSLVDGSDMFSFASLESFSGDLSSLANGSNMFASTSLTSFDGNLSNLIDGSTMFYNTSLESFSGDLSSLVNGDYMFSHCKLTPQSVMYIVESIRNITEEKAKYPNSETGELGEIPWVTYDSTTQKYSAPFGFMEDGQYVYTFNFPNPSTTTISASNVGQLTLGIDVTNDPETIEQQLQTFAEECLYESWDKLKEAFSNKGWAVTFQYGGTDSSITLSEDEQFRGVPVYARLIEVSDENKDKAKYCTEDGTKFYNIDWGHDVTDYDQYQYFGSLLEACGYFGVIPVKYLEEN